jgi:hypothetical protein
MALFFQDYWQTVPDRGVRVKSREPIWFLSSLRKYPLNLNRIIPAQGSEGTTGVPVSPELFLT